MIFLILSLTAGTAAAFDRDPFPDGGPGPKPYCSQARMNECISSHRHLLSLEESLVAETDRKIGLAERDKNRLIRSKNSFSSERAAIEITAAMLQAEEKESSRPSGSAEFPVFPGGPGLEKIKNLTDSPTAWGEYHGEIRKNRLRASGIQLAEKLRRIDSMERKFAMEISSLDNELTALQASRAAHSGNARAHASMCEQGCRDQYCSGN